MVACDRTPCQLYDSGFLLDVTGDGLRPGGLALTERALGLCGVRAGERVVDVGCGTGSTVAHARRALALDAIGVDSSAALLRRGARSTPATPRVRATGAALPLRSATAEVVLLESSFSALREKERALAECRRILVPGGRLAMTDLYARNRVDAAGREALRGSCLAGVMTREELERALEAAGFAVDRWEDHSPSLTELLCRVVLEHGSLRPFWEAQGFTSGEVPDAMENARQLRPGYFLLVATRNDTPGKGAPAWTTNA
jgi:arsenite methyltransferase